MHICRSAATKTVGHAVGLKRKGGNAFYGRKQTDKYKIEAQGLKVALVHNPSKGNEKERKSCRNRCVFAPRNRLGVGKTYRRLSLFLAESYRDIDGFFPWVLLYGFPAGFFIETGFLFKRSFY